MKILVLSIAEEEFGEAVDYYNEQPPGLGFEFAAEVQRTFERVRRLPQAWPVFFLFLCFCFILPCNATYCNRIY